MSAPKKAAEAERAYTPQEAADLKGVSYGYVVKAIRAKKGNVLAAKKVGRGYRISASALEAWFDGLADA